MTKTTFTDELEILAPAHLGAPLDLQLQTGLPAAPLPGILRLYARSDGELYTQTEAGIEQSLKGAAPAYLHGIAGEPLLVRDFVYLNPADNQWYAMDTDADPMRCGRLRGVVAERNAEEVIVQFTGEIAGYQGLVPGEWVYASMTPGGYSQTHPLHVKAGAQVVIIRLGIATSTTTILLTPGYKAQFAKRQSLLDNETMTLQHYADPFAHNRQYHVFLSHEVSLATYASSHQDMAFPLRGANGEVSTTTPATSGAGYRLVGTDGTPYWTTQSMLLPAGTLTQITFLLNPNIGTPTGTLTWELRANNGGNPGAVLQSDTHTPTPNTTNTITVTNGVTLSAGTYWLLLRPTSSQTNGNGWSWQQAGDVYANGSSKQTSDGGSSWVVIIGGDLVCSITIASGDAKNKLAQSFQTNSTASSGQVKLWLRKAGSPTGTLTLRLETDSQGTPSGNLVAPHALATIAESSLPTTFNWMTFEFASPVSLNSNTPYWLVLSSDRAASGTNYIEWGVDGSSPGYTNGQIKTYTDAWNSESKDGIFNVIAIDTFFDSPLSVCSWNADVAEVEIVAGNGSGVNVETQTTLRNRKNITADIVLRVELP